MKILRDILHYTGVTTTGIVFLKFNLFERHKGTIEIRRGGERASARVREILLPPVHWKSLDFIKG